MPLGIDFTQIFLHIFNVIILFAGLYILLYKPVKTFMEKREKFYEDMRDQAEGKLKEAEDLKNEYFSRLEKADTEIRDRKVQAEEQLMEEKLRSEKEARMSAEKIVEDARKEAERQRSLIVGGARTDISRMIEKAAKKMIFDEDDATGYDAFLEEAERSAVHDADRV
ncbi:MAG: ATP synthase F0 subunit B [Lachnospiraceae bacterium]|nr:ATP synthase F0 subunit B [Lachnospiraceae bacterium]